MVRPASRLPVGNAAAEQRRRLDADGGEDARRNPRAQPRLADRDDRRSAAELLTAHPHKAVRHVLAPGDVPVVSLVRLAHVDEERRLRSVEELAGARGVHFVDLGPHLGKQVAVARHDFQEYSGAGSAYVGADRAGTLGA